MLEGLKKLMGLKCNEEIKVFMLGRVLVLAKDEGDVEEAFRAIGTPPYVPDEALEEWRGSYAISTRKEGNRLKLLVAELNSMSEALKLANAICSKFYDCMPHRLIRVDVTTSFKASEDGGIFHRHFLECIVDDRNGGVLDDIRSFVEVLLGTPAEHQNQA